MLLTCGLQALAQSYSGGAGTAASPYLIANKTDLKYLSEHATEWGKSFKQTAHIFFDSTDFQTGGGFYNSGAGFIPIGTLSNPFYGTYDGGHFTISNIYIYRPSQNDVGLFGCVSGATIHNLGLLGGYVAGADDVGGFCGLVNSGGNSQFANCYSTASVSGGDNVGGLIGWNIPNSTYLLCYTSCTVNSSQYSGGFVGRTNSGVFLKCYATGNVSSSGSAGGFVGTAQGTYYFHQCFANAVVSGNSGSGQGQGVGGFAGGIVSGNVNDCYAGGTASDYNSNAQVGGFVGSMNSIAINAATSLTNVANCYATCIPYGTASNGNVDGFFGFASFLYGNCPDYCYFDNQLVGSTADPCGLGYYGIANSPTSFVGFDFANNIGFSPTVNGYWNYNSNRNNGYPYLTWEDQATYSVNYVTCIYTGGSLPVDTVLRVRGATATIKSPGSLSRNSYCFAGWNTKEDGTGTSYAPGATLTMPGRDVALYAQWTVNNMAVSFSNPPHSLADSPSVRVPFSISNGTATHYSLSSNLPGFVPVSLAPLSGSAINISLPASTPAGSYTFSFTAKDSAGNCSASQSFSLVVDSASALKERRGNALKLNGINQYAATNAPLSTATQNVTMEAWVKLSAYPSTNALIIYNGNSYGNGYGLLLGSGGSLYALHAGINLVQNPSVTLPLNTWMHLAYRIDNSNSVQVYLNGQSIISTNMGAYTPSDSFTIGSFAGEIDEVRFWNTLRTEDEIRQNMHLTLPSGATGLGNYYQFNNLSNTAANDWVGNKPAFYHNGPAYSGSEANTSKGVSYGIVAPAVSTNYTFPGTGVTLNFGNATTGHITVSRLEGLPTGTQVSSTGSVHTRHYWVIDNDWYGATNTGLNVTATFVLGAGMVSAGDSLSPANLKLNKRPSNLGGSWSTVINGSAATASTGTIVFTGIDGFSDFVISSAGSSPLPLTILTLEGSRTDPGHASLHWQTATESNLTGYDLEYSEDGATFSKVCFVPCNCSGVDRNNYSRLVENAAGGYFRLKATDNGGGYRYSNIVKISASAAVAELRVYPNPAGNTVTIENARVGELLQITDITGRELQRITVTAPKCSIDLSGYSGKVLFIKAANMTPVKLIRQ